MIAESLKTWNLQLATEHLNESDRGAIVVETFNEEIVSDLEFMSEVEKCDENEDGQRKNDAL